MDQELVLSAPLSTYAKKELANLKEGSLLIFWVPAFSVFVEAMFAAMICIENSDLGLRTWLWSVCIMAAIWAFFALCALYGYLTRVVPGKPPILEENVRDYNRAQVLKATIFPRFTNTRSDEFPLRETPIRGIWRAFKVEHFVSQSLRGDISGRFCLDLWSFFTGSGQVSTQLKQLAVPDLIDMSSIVFFENDAGETLRVLVPSPRATKETLARLIETYIGRNNEYNRYEGGIVTDGTYVHETLRQFTADESSLLEPISHPAVLDHLDAATHKSPESRPAVQVVGEMIQKGVALATSLTVEGVKKVFYPSGYLGEFASGVAFVLDKERQPANLLETVR